jgi:hypothetical protein
LRAVLAAGLLCATPAVAGVALVSARAAAPISARGTFVSLLRLCRHSSPFDTLLTGCRHGHYVEDLEQFSTADGRRIGAVTPVPSDETNVQTPAGTSDGTVLLTYTVGPRCLDHGKPLKKVTMECAPSPNSCINTVMAVSPSHPTPTRLFAVSTAQIMGVAVPNPSGTEVAYSATPCVGTRPAPALYIRNLKTGATRALLTTSYCSSIGRPSWNAAGTEIVLRYQSVSARLQPAPVGSSGPACSDTRASAWNLEVERTAITGRPATLLPAPHHCSLDAAAFDPGGLLAAEGCTPQHHSMSSTGATRGAVELVQYDSRGNVTTTIPLPYRGLDPEQTLIANEPGSNRLLITQDQPNGLVARNDDHIYEMSGTHLRQIVENSWGSDFMAVPW